MLLKSVQEDNGGRGRIMERMNQNGYNIYIHMEMKLPV
jgi:hypothetical protein